MQNNRPKDDNKIQRPKRCRKDGRKIFLRPKEPPKYVSTGSSGIHKTEIGISVLKRILKSRVRDLPLFLLVQIFVSIDPPVHVFTIPARLFQRCLAPSVPVRPPGRGGRWVTVTVRLRSGQHVRARERSSRRVALTHKLLEALPQRAAPPRAAPHRVLGRTLGAKAGLPARHLQP